MLVTLPPCVLDAWLSPHSSSSLCLALTTCSSIFCLTTSVFICASMSSSALDHFRYVHAPALKLNSNATKTPHTQKSFSLEYLVSLRWQIFSGCNRTPLNYLYDLILTVCNLSLLQGLFVAILYCFLNQEVSRNTALTSLYDPSTWLFGLYTTDCCRFVRTLNISQYGWWMTLFIAAVCNFWETNLRLLWMHLLATIIALWDISFSDIDTRFCSLPLSIHWQMELTVIGCDCKSKVLARRSWQWFPPDLQSAALSL